MANINELMDGWSYGKQTNIATAAASTAIWRLTNLNTKPWAKVPVNEDDRAEIGKGHEFPTQLFKSHYNMPAYELSKYASSEFLAWAMSFSMGNVVVSGSGPYTYTIVPALGATNPTGLELPYFSFVQQIRPGGSAVLDEMLVGCAVKGWKLSIKNSPGRASAMCAVECVTTGQYTSPSGITLPAISTPHEFNAGMISALTFNGINYLSGGSAKQLVSMEASWENNFRPGFFPGSGAQDGRHGGERPPSDHLRCGWAGRARWCVQGRRAGPGARVHRSEHRRDHAEQRGDGGADGYPGRRHGSGCSLLAEWCRRRRWRFGNFHSVDLDAGQDERTYGGGRLL